MPMSRPQAGASQAGADRWCAAAVIHTEETHAVPVDVADETRAIVDAVCNAGLDLTDSQRDLLYQAAPLRDGNDGTAATRSEAGIMSRPCT